MLRGENIVCGTSSTGTGTLTLAATPASVGASDFDVLARASGIGFGNNAAVLTTYCIKEFTDNTFTTPKQEEKGIGTLTLGASAGIANATLARTTVQQTATNLNAPPATYNVSAPSAINIGVTANTLVFIGVAAADVPAYSPYFDNAGGSADQYGVPPVSVAYEGTGPASGDLTNNRFYYGNFMWAVPMVAKRATIRCSTAYSGGTPVSNAYVRLYDVAASGKPGKLFYDFGLLGTAGTSLNSTGVVQTGAGGNGYLILPGDYWFCLAVSFSGGVTAPRVNTSQGCAITSGRGSTNIFGANALLAAPSFTANGTVSGTPDDPAVVTSWSVDNDSMPAFALHTV